MPWSMPSAGSVEPTGVGEAPVLSAAQLRRWSQEGWLCVQGLMPPELLEQASEQAAAVYPPPSAVAAPEPEPLPYDGDVQKAFSAKDMKAALGLEKGCVTAMSVVNDVACKITSVIDKRCIGGNFRMCSGCNDPKDHTQHHISEQSTESLMAFLEACGHAPMIFDHEANTVEKN